MTTLTSVSPLLDELVAAVGAGAWGKNYVRNLSALGVLHAVCDQNEQALAWVKAQSVHFRFWLALEAFVTRDVVKAEKVIADDDHLDTLYHKMFNDLVVLMMEDAKNIRRATALMFTAKHLERFGDHATNLAEMVVFMVRGTDVRHPHSREGQAG